LSSAREAVEIEPESVKLENLLEAVVKERLVKVQ
jgi:hypothetical protein